MFRFQQYLNKSSYKIKKNYWWRFWQIDEILVKIPSVYEDAYLETEVKTESGHQLSFELEKWVIEDLREQLVNFFQKNKSDKKLFQSKSYCVRFSTSLMNQRYSDKLTFFIIKESDFLDIVFESDTSFQRMKSLEKLGL